MAYKWCVVPLCTNTSVRTPQKLFVSVPKDPKRRKKWLQIARRDPYSIESHSNVFMCEDHFELEKDLKNYMKYKMGFSKRLLLADHTIPTKFCCQENNTKQQSDDESSQEITIKEESLDMFETCLQSQNATDVKINENFQKDKSIKEEIIEPEGLPKSLEIGTITDSVMSKDASVQVTTKIKLHVRSKVVQRRYENKSISTIPFKVPTISQYTTNFPDENSNSDMLYFENDDIVITLSSRLTD